MSDKEKNGQTQEQSQAQEQAPETPDLNERVEVYYPKGSDRGDPNVTVIINGKNWVIPRGKKCHVPRYVAEELKRSENAKENFFRTSESLQKNELPTG